MKLVYIAMPYKAPTAEEIAENIARAQAFGLRLGTLGGRILPVVPHSLGLGMDGLGDRDYWLAATMHVMVTRCDCVVAGPGWNQSEGAVLEVARAENFGIPAVRAGEDWTESELREAVAKALWRWRT